MKNRLNALDCLRIISSDPNGDRNMSSLGDHVRYSSNPMARLQEQLKGLREILA